MPSVPARGPHGRAEPPRKYLRSSGTTVSSETLLSGKGILVMSCEITESIPSTDDGQFRKK